MIIQILLNNIINNVGEEKYKGDFLYCLLVIAMTSTNVDGRLSLLIVHCSLFKCIISICIVHDVKNLVPRLEEGVSSHYIIYMPYCCKCRIVGNL